MGAFARSRVRFQYFVRCAFSGRYAWLGNTLSGAGLFLLGDAVEQYVEIWKGKHKEFDMDRFKRIGLIGLFQGPSNFFFYRYLDLALPGNTISIVAKKIVIDQCIGSPMFSIQFFVGMSLMEGQSWNDSWKEFFAKFPTVFMMDCLMWPPFQFVNFYLVPAKYRVLYVNVVTVIWNVFLSYMKHYDHYPAPEPDLEPPLPSEQKDPGENS